MFNHHSSQVLSAGLCRSTAIVNCECSSAKIVLSNDHAGSSFYGDRNVCDEYAL